ncbi:RHS repeat domain-containing protein [Roseibium alexandrii]
MAERLESGLQVTRFGRLALVSLLSASVMVAGAPGDSQNAFAQAIVEPAETVPAAMPDDIGFKGAFAQKITFKVPEWRGLEPKLGISYDSSRANSYGPNDVLGAGWRLSGLSTIQRASPRRGTPNFDSSDIWLLDGHELVDCGSYAGAGCGSGATHATWIENYQRIKQVSANNTWEITARDGTRYIYQPLSAYNGGAAAQSTGYRYLLAQKIDTLGQEVTFNYTCDTAVDCFVSNIVYGIGEIHFHWSARPDEISYAAGTMLGTISKRLTAVEVRSAGQMLRSYKLDYVESPATKRSLLSAVQEFGTDAVIAGGLVTAGTSMPPHSFQYTGAVAAVRQVADGLGYGGTIDRTAWRFSKSFGDFGADRKLHMVTYSARSYTEGTGDNITNRVRCEWERSDTNEVVQLGDSEAGNIDFQSKCPMVERIAFMKKAHGLSKQIMVRTYTENYPNGNNGDPVKVYDGSAPQIVADFNGDGLDDGLEFDENGVLEKVTISPNDQSWSFTGSEGKALDLNADGLADVSAILGDGRTIQGMVSTGQSFVDLSYGQIDSIVNNHTYTTGDFNGDGAADFLVWPAVGDQARIYYSAGQNIVQGPTITLADLGWGGVESPYWPFSADVDGDGRDDIITHRIGSTDVPQARVWLNRGDSFPLIQGGSNSDTFAGAIVDIRDADADGFVEAALKTVKDVDNEWQGFGKQRYAFASEKPDLLSFVRQPLGAEIKPAYAHHVPETQPDLPLSLNVVTSVETYDGRTVRSTTDYAYSGAKWDWEHRRFLGFRKITATLPQVAGESGRPVVETTYRQDLASFGKVEDVVFKDGASTVLKRRQESYTAQSSTKPFTSLNTQTATTTYYGGVARTSRQVREYDVHGQVFRTTHHGNTDTAGDEWVETRWSYPNVSKYIADRWAVEVINSGTAYSETENLKLRRYHAFDNQAVDASPDKGLKTAVSEWTGKAIAEDLRLKSLTYDAYGNVKTEANALGETTTYIYDSTYNLFPVEVRNPLYSSNSSHKRTFTWDPVCGVKLTETDENGAVTSHSYDALCRLTQTNLPEGGQVTFDYYDWGTPATSRNTRRELHPNGSGTIGEDEYFDGLGRTWQTIATGSPGTIDDDRSVTLVFDARGNVEQRSHPYYPAETPVFTYFRFDGLNRQISQNNPDGTKVTTNYLAGDAFTAVEAIDELGQKRISHFDAFGNEVFRDRYNGSERQRTTFSYDVLNRMTGIVDPVGSGWVYEYDGHGNRIVINDPNLGCQNLSYDAALRLKDHRYANGSTISYQYDALGRTTAKTVNADTMTYPSCGVTDPDPDPDPDPGNPGEGDNIYEIRHNGGDQVIQEAANGGNDTIRFVDMVLSDLAITSEAHSSGQILRFAWSKNGHTANVQVSENGQHIERYEFADGTTLSKIEIGYVNQVVATGTSGDDYIKSGAFGPGNFPALQYIASHNDLISSLGANATAGTEHYVSLGKAEGRTITFNSLAYLASHPDLVSSYGEDREAAARHYIQSGRNEGRQITFSMEYYLRNYDDMRSTYGRNIKGLAEHYIRFGRAEGRVADGLLPGAMTASQWATFAAQNPQVPDTVLNPPGGYTTANFPGMEYIASYPDLMGAFGANATNGMYHYFDNGRYEGRRPTFSGLTYIASHTDLIGAYGINREAGAEHYINNGYAEGRPIWFDYSIYLRNYPDLRQTYGNDPVAVTKHYILNGVNEGRVANSLIGSPSMSASAWASYKASNAEIPDPDITMDARGFAPGSDDNYVFGGAGNDRLEAGPSGAAGYQHLFGQSGNDTYVIASNSGAVLIQTSAETAGGGTDVVEFRNLNFGNLSASHQYVDGTQGTVLRLQWSGGHLDIAQKAENIELFRFADGSTRTTCEVFNYAGCGSGPVTPGSHTFTATGTLFVPAYNTLTIEISGGGGEAGGQIIQEGTGENTSLYDGPNGAAGGDTVFQSMIARGGTGGTGAKVGHWGKQPAAAGGTAQGGNQANTQGGGAAPGTTIDFGDARRSPGDGGAGGLARSTWQQGQAGAPAAGSTIPFTIGAGGSSLNNQFIVGTGGYLKVTWQ